DGERTAVRSLRRGALGPGFLCDGKQLLGWLLCHWPGVFCPGGLHAPGRGAGAFSVCLVLGHDAAADRGASAPPRSEEGTRTRPLEREERMARGSTRIADAEQRGSKQKKVRSQQGQPGGADPLPLTFSDPRGSAHGIRVDPQAILSWFS